MFWASNFITKEKKEWDREREERRRNEGREKGRNVKNTGNDCQWVKIFLNISYLVKYFKHRENGIIVEAE